MLTCHQFQGDMQNRLSIDTCSIVCAIESLGLHNLTPSIFWICYGPQKYYHVTYDLLSFSPIMVTSKFVVLHFIPSILPYVLNLRFFFSSCQVQTEYKRIVSPLKYQTRCVAAFPDLQGFLVRIKTHVFILVPSYLWCLWFQHMVPSFFIFLCSPNLSKSLAGKWAKRI